MNRYTRITAPTLAQARAHATIAARTRPERHEYILAADDGRSVMMFEGRR